MCTHIYIYIYTYTCMFVCVHVAWYLCAHTYAKDELKKMGVTVQKAGTKAYHNGNNRQ